MKTFKIIEMCLLVDETVCLQSGRRGDGAEGPIGGESV